MLFCAAGLSFGIGAIVALDGTLLLEELIQAKEVIRFLDHVRCIEGQ